MLAYVAVITTMVIGGFAVSLRGAGAHGLVTAGAVAFYLSDLAVARDKFVTRDPMNRIVGLPIYYGAQLLFAWGTIPT